MSPHQRFTLGEHRLSSPSLVVQSLSSSMENSCYRMMPWMSRIGVFWVVSDVPPPSPWRKKRRGTKDNASAGDGHLKRADGNLRRTTTNPCEMSSGGVPIRCPNKQRRENSDGLPSKCRDYNRWGICTVRPRRLEGRTGQGLPR